VWQLYLMICHFKFLKKNRRMIWTLTVCHRQRQKQTNYIILLNRRRHLTSHELRITQSSCCSCTASLDFQRRGQTQNTVNCGHSVVNCGHCRELWSLCHELWSLCRELWSLCRELGSLSRIVFTQW
jgi:hypothetical protein